jgi:hypothetical protein
VSSHPIRRNWQRRPPSVALAATICLVALLLGDIAGSARGAAAAGPQGTIVFQAGAGRITGLAADGKRVALLVLKGCRRVVVWEASSGRAARVTSVCSVDLPIDTTDIALAGTRVAWLETVGQNVIYTTVKTATLAHRKPVGIAEGYATPDRNPVGTVAGNLAGDGVLLAFTLDQRCDAFGNGNGVACPPGRADGAIVAATVWRIGGSGRCPGSLGSGRPAGCTVVAKADGELSILAVDTGRVAVRTKSGVRLLTESGRVLRDFTVKASAAALSGKRLAVRRADAVEVYDAGSGQLTARFPVAKGVRLEDLEGDILATASGTAVTLRSLGNGRTITIRTRGIARAQLEPPGLFVAGAHRVTFTPMSTVLRRLGS